jgi:hypothetical protein
VESGIEILDGSADMVKGAGVRSLMIRSWAARVVVRYR